MRSFNALRVVIGAACLVAATACSDDEASTDTNPLQPAAGAAGSAAAGRGGSAGAASAGAAGSSSGGSANAGGGVGGSAGAAGAAGAAGSGAEPEVDAGAEPSADAGAEPVEPAEPDAGGEPPVIEEPPVEEPPADTLSFAADVLPIFAASCGPCHTTGSAGGHSVGGALPGSYDDALELGDTLLVRVSGGATGGMPQTCANNEVPGDPGCLTVEQVQLISDWIDQGSQP